MRWNDDGGGVVAKAELFPGHDLPDFDDNAKKVKTVEGGDS
jgi:hypothetical protein